MPFQGLEFIRLLLFVAAVFLAVAAIGLFLMEADRTARRRPRRKRLAEWWRARQGLPWGALLAESARACAGTWDAARTALFDQADRATWFAVLVTFVLFAFIPFASVVNAMIGGSPFLATVVGMCAMGFLVLNVTGEFRSLKPLAQILSLSLFMATFVFIPAYVFKSFTIRLITEPMDRVGFEMFAVAPFCYIAAKGAGMLIQALLPRRVYDRTALGLAVRDFLFALPLAFLFAFAGLIAGYVSETRFANPGHIQLVYAAMAGGALAWTATLAALRVRSIMAAPFLALSAAFAAACGYALLWSGHAGTRYAIAHDAIVGALFGEGLELGPEFWLSHLPMAPLAALVLALLGGAATRAFAGPEAPKRPFGRLAMASGSAGGVAGLAAWLI